MRVGSLFSGYGGLDLALGGVTEWVSEIEPAACTVLAERFDAPNFGDITALDEAPPVDIITAGFPCQPVSTAGRRKGVDDERWLFDDIARIASRMEPSPRLFLENVPGLLTANGGDAMARVVEGLARIGYVGRYGLLPASAIGAPHRRIRWFCVADPADPTHVGHERGREARRRRHGPADSDNAATNSDSEGPQRHRRPVQRAREQPAPESGAQPVADADGERLQERWLPETEEREHCPDSARCHGLGPYTSACERWAAIIGRPAPDPLTDSPSGLRLNPVFVEWMMGLEEGWVTDIPDLSRTQQLRMLGNGVVPQQARLAYQLLTS